MIGRTLSLWKLVHLLCNLRILVPSDNSTFPGHVWKQVDHRCSLEQQLHCLLRWQMLRVSQKWHLQTFLGRKQISATSTAFPGHKHLWNMVQDYFSEQKTPATTMSAPSGSRHECVLKNGNMSHGCLLKELQWFLPLGEDKQQSKGHSWSRGVGKLKYDGFHWGHYY